MTDPSDLFRDELEIEEDRIIELRDMMLDRVPLGGLMPYGFVELELTLTKEDGTRLSVQTSQIDGIPAVGLTVTSKRHFTETTERFSPDEDDDVVFRGITETSEFWIDLEDLTTQYTYERTSIENLSGHNFEGADDDNDFEDHVSKDALITPSVAFNMETYLKEFPIISDHLAL